ncbi:hypothetical protein BH18ACT7_BH18ACT7_14870 [soil metagenome]
MDERVKVSRRRGYTRVSSKNQVTLPAAALAAAHLGPGDELRVDVDADGALRLARATDPVHDLIGSAPGLSADSALEDLRGEWRG